ncbi:M12 family metallopeptidase [Candidatus Nitrosocosmicus franklandus]|uniref:Peptidase M12A domain-containing protein n=1 Tax=Candidatus Nitrosocosmicus franklandianus TaxID=1798806 RepID=A0A484I711_9ARCH|nr:M12 family metallopeptidase [Candidatus Nitrosocosmicus franklandus]VFJ12896.1 conserved protein of unknown function [Candidatus Nitrosocosmicus franklandus]
MENNSGKKVSEDQIGKMPSGLDDFHIVDNTDSTSQRSGQGAEDQIGKMPSGLDDFHIVDNTDSTSQRSGQGAEDQIGKMPSGLDDFPSAVRDKESAEGICREFSEGTDTKKGFISGNTFTKKEVEYSVIDGVSIFEGDIAIKVTDNENATPSDDGDTNRAVIIPGSQFRWPNNTVPYEIDGALPNQQRVTDAVSHIQSRTGVRFIMRNSSNASSFPDYIRFERRDGCWSYVGRQGGKQIISLADGCGTGSTIHEICHALGCWHEQSREDRDTFIRINWENIQDANRHNFNQHITDGDDVGQYDYCSIMHYPATAFSKNGQPTIQVLRTDLPCGAAIGQRNGLSDGDIAAINLMYPRAGWGTRGGKITSEISVGRNKDGRLEIFARGTDNALWHTWQVAPNGGWVNGWASRGGIITSDPVVAQNADGRLEVFARGTDNGVWHTWQVAPNGGWVNGWATRGGRITSNIAVGRNKDGRLEIFARGTDNALWHTWQVAPNGGWVNGWASRGGIITSDPVVAQNADGRLEVFARGTDNGVWHTWQVAPNGGWVNGWATRGGRITSNIAVGRNKDGRLEIFARGTDNALWHTWQTAPSNGWVNGWASRGGIITSDPVVAQNADGRLEVFARGTDNALWHTWQTAPSNGWVNGWASRGGIITSDPVVAQNADGRLEVFARGADHAVWHIWQTAPNNGWSF